MFDMAYFKRDQKPFFDFAAEIWPGTFAPSPSHHFIKQVETHGKLIRCVQLLPEVATSHHTSHTAITSHAHPRSRATLLDRFIKQGETHDNLILLHHDIAQHTTPRLHTRTHGLLHHHQLTLA
jgi:hypothetical protein